MKGIDGQGTFAKAPITSGQVGQQKPTLKQDNSTFEPDSIKQVFPYRTYVTPDDYTITALADRIRGVEEAYEVAVRWAYVSEDKLNSVADCWLTPHEFLAETPRYASNPLQG